MTYTERADCHTEGESSDTLPVTSSGANGGRPE
jgi:hypothetical protein